MITRLLIDGIYREAGLPLSDRGFRYGMSAFETVAIRNGRPLLLDAHLAKLTATAAAAQLRPPAGWEPATRAAAGEPPISEGVMRIYLTAGDHDAAPGRAALLFEALPLPATFTTATAVLRDFTPAVPFGKTGNYWPNVLAQPADGEALLVPPGGDVGQPTSPLLGAPMANLVLIREGRLLTPAAAVRRGVVCEWLGAEPAALTVADLATAEELFLTNSRIGIRGLSAVENRSYPSAQTEQLWRRYQREVLDA